MVISQTRNMVSQISTLLNNLVENDDRLAGMTDILIYINSVGPATITEIGEQTQFGILFDCLGGDR